MTLRELLQYEVWSKRTTRKILLALGTVAGFFLLLGAYEWFWTTPGERVLGSMALVQIDELDELGPGSPRFDVESKKADGMVAAATQAAFTLRDRRIAAALGAYLMLVEMEREDIERRMRMQEFERAHPEMIQRYPNDEVDEELLSRQTRQFIRSRLHAVLDYTGFNL
jgi:hypothetical protein